MQFPSSLIVAVFTVWLTASECLAQTFKERKSSAQKTNIVKKEKKPLYDVAANSEFSRISAPTASLSPLEINGFFNQPAAIQELLANALTLTKKNLTYQFGSSDPRLGGMDCSGTIYYLLKLSGLKNIPRDSTGMYLWVEKSGKLHRTSAFSLSDPQFNALRPGDLLFWKGTYASKRNPAVSHTMIYLGIESATGKPVVVGASDGRSYKGVRRNGVSVFDFKLPKQGDAAQFIGYGAVPGLEGIIPAKSSQPQLTQTGNF